MPTIQFKGKSVIETYHHSVPHHRLEFAPELSVLPKGQKPALDGNLIIEGDNLLALKALLPTHAGKIKCVYIDPPYNTGNEGWIYNDNLTQPQFKEWIGKEVGKEGEDATRHDKWCCMMYPRLQLLRELLRDDGAIFISVDDNEFHHLRMLMDDVFGEQSFLACICWQKKYSASNDHQGVAPMHDFLLAYCKSPAFTRNLLPRTNQQDRAYKNPDGDPRGPWKAADYTCNKTREERPNLYYSIGNPHTGAEVWPDERRVWAYSEGLTEEYVADDRLWWGKDGANSVPALKNFLSEVQGGLVPTTWWPQEDVGHTDEAKKEVQRILGALGSVTTPKPVDLLRRVVLIATRKEDLVLDSFAGSGTLAEAVLKVNAADGGKRRFILVQMRHDTRDHEVQGLNICEQVTAARVRKVIEGYEYQGVRKKLQKVVALGGCFSYARVGDPLFTEYRDWGKAPPSYEDLAKYVFYTETSRDIDLGKIDPETGFIGATEAAGGTSYYLLYTPNEQADREMSTSTLKALVKRDQRKNWVIYCEKIWIHLDELRQFEDEHSKRIRPMLVPFNLK